MRPTDLFFYSVVALTSINLLFIHYICGFTRTRLWTKRTSKEKIGFEGSWPLKFSGEVPRHLCDDYV